MGISKNIRDRYRFIFVNFESGDEIFLFGFSRGATTVRGLFGFIHYFGILPKAPPVNRSRRHEGKETPRPELEGIAGAEDAYFWG